MSTANWIKLRVNIWDKAEAQYIAENCGIPIEHAVGILCRLWTWFDQHTEKGVTNKFGTKMVGKYTRLSVTDERDECVIVVTGVEILVTPFLEAMQEVGWIELTDEGFWSLTNWEEHNGETAKTRAGNQKRQAKARAKKDKSNLVTDKRDEGVTREEKRREEKIIKEIESVGSLEVYEELKTNTHAQNETSFISGYPNNSQEVVDHAYQFCGRHKPFPERCIEFYELWLSSGWEDSNGKLINWKQKLTYFLRDYQENKPKEDPNQGNRDFIEKFYGGGINATAIK